MKKMVSMACISAMLATGIPSGVYAAEAVSGSAVTLDRTKLAPAAEDCMQKIYECLTKKGSDFDKMIKDMKKTSGGLLTTHSDIHDDTITITLVGKKTTRSRAVPGIMCWRETISLLSRRKMISWASRFFRL